MPECVILFRNSQNRRVGFISDADDGEEIAVFKDREDAEKAATDIVACRIFPYQVVELEEIS